jgi:hypothetical protein
LTEYFRPHYGPSVDSAPNRNEYQEYFLGDKRGRCVGLTAISPSCADCLEIWEPQPPGTLRVCTGIALTFVWISITVLHSDSNNGTYYRSPPILFYGPTALLPQCDHTNIMWIFSFPGGILDINGVSEWTLLRRQAQLIVKILYGNRHSLDITSP